MCDSGECCQKPKALKDKPAACSAEQIRKCHGDAAKHPCVSDKKES